MEQYWNGDGTMGWHPSLKVGLSGTLASLCDLHVCLHLGWSHGSQNLQKGVNERTYDLDLRRRTFRVNCRSSSYVVSYSDQNCLHNFVTQSRRQGSIGLICLRALWRIFEYHTISTGCWAAHPPLSIHEPWAPACSSGWLSTHWDFSSRVWLRMAPPSQALWK